MRQYLLLWLILYADEVEYSIIDQNDQQLYGPILIKEKL